jgi:hypothetical protein
MRVALTVVAGLAIVAGCSSSATPTPSPISDPQLLLTQSVAKTADVSSLHIKIDLSGKVNTSSLGESASMLGGSFDLTGTNVEGDVDVKKQAADLKFAMPGLLSLSGEVIVIDGYAYTKISLQGDKFTKSKLSDLTGGLPVSVPSAMPSAGAVVDQVAALRKSMQDAGVTMTMKGDDKIDGKDAYHVEVGLPMDKINTLLASGAANAPKLDSANVDAWFYKDDSLPAKVEIKGASSTIGNLDMVMTMTGYNKAVTIAAPSADQIQAG